MKLGDIAVIEKGYMDPPYPILAAYLGNLGEKHKPKALYLVQEAE